MGSTAGVITAMVQRRCHAASVLRRASHVGRVPAPSPLPAPSPSSNLVLRVSPSSPTRGNAAAVPQPWRQDLTAHADAAPTLQRGRQQGLWPSVRKSQTKPLTETGAPLFPRSGWTRCAIHSKTQDLTRSQRSFQPARTHDEERDRSGAQKYQNQILIRFYRISRPGITLRSTSNRSPVQEPAGTQLRLVHIRVLDSG